MNWKIKVSSEAEKYLSHLDKDMKKRVKEALIELSKCTNSLTHGSAKPLTGELKDFYRLKVGNYRIVFSIITESGTIAITNIAPRGGAY